MREAKKLFEKDSSSAPALMQANWMPYVPSSATSLQLGALVWKSESIPSGLCAHAPFIPHPNTHAKAGKAIALNIRREYRLRFL